MLEWLFVHGLRYHKQFVCKQVNNVESIVHLTIRYVTNWNLKILRCPLLYYGLTFFGKGRIKHLLNGIYVYTRIYASVEANLVRGRILLRHKRKT